MEEIESQVAKIQIGNTKNATSYIFILAEKAPASSAELYVLAELPLFNPAAESSCEKICLAIDSALKRTYKRGAGENTFETAVAQVNEELGKLAEMGQTHWIDKLNCILASKDNTKFSIATCGKVAAYLYRNDEFTDISCSPQTTHPLKTFENVAFGKLKLDDVIILSTTQLFNHLSIDRLRDILQHNNFLNAAQTIIEILKENAGPEVAFGTLLNLQVEPGNTPNEEIDLEDYTPEKTARISLFSKITSTMQSALALGGEKKRTPKTELPKLATAYDGRFKNVGSNTKLIAKKSKDFISKLGSTFRSKQKDISLEQIRNFSRQKKFFLVSAIVLVLAVVLELFVAAHFKKTKQAQTHITSQLTSVQTLISNAEAALLYKDTAGAQNYVLQAQNSFPTIQGATASDQKLASQIQDKLAELKQKLENSKTVQAANLGNLGAANTLLNLGDYLASQINSTIVSYSKTNGTIQDNILLSSQKIISAAYIKNTTAVVYNGSELLVWDFAKKQFSAPFSSSVPNASAFVGIKYYPTNNRVYAINKSANQIVSFAVGSAIAKPVVASKNANDLGSALDMAIDGSVYVLNSAGINKYQSGSLSDFHMPTLFTPFSGKGKIATEIGWKNIYVLDIGNNRILVIDKSGNLIEVLKAKEFTDVKDFQVDEKAGIAYILNGSNLLKISVK